MDTYIYVHHKGHVSFADSRSKVVLRRKKKNFFEVYYDVTKMLPILMHGKEYTCKEYEKYTYDYCITDVSMRFFSILFHKYVHIYSSYLIFPFIDIRQLLLEKIWMCVSTSNKSA